MEQWKGGSRWCQAHTALWVDLLHWGPDERFPSFAEEPNKAIFRCLPRPWNKAEKIAVVNSFSSMWLEINSALAAEGQRPSQWQAQPEASTKTKDKRDLWLSAMIAVAPLFSSLEDWTIYTHRKPVWRSEIYRCFKSGLWCSDLQFLWRIPTSAFPRASCKGESSMFALPDSRLAVANPRWGFDVCLNPRAPSSMLDGSLNVAGSPFELIAIKKKFCLRSHPQIGIHFLVAIASTHPQHWQWGRRGSVCGWPLWGPCKERWPYWVLKRCACSASTFTMAARSSQALHLPRFNF